MLYCMQFINYSSAINTPIEIMMHNVWLTSASDYLIIYKIYTCKFCKEIQWNPFHDKGDNNSPSKIHINGWSAIIFVSCIMLIFLVQSYRKIQFALCIDFLKLDFFLFCYCVFCKSIPFKLYLYYIYSF